MRRRLLAALAILVLAACARDAGPFPTGPSLYNVSIKPANVDPGHSFEVSFRIDYDGPWDDISNVTLVGLPDNTVAAGTITHLNLPAARGEPSKTVVFLNKPAADGIYPLELHVNVENGANLVFRGLGPLVVNDVPARLAFAGFDPSTHSVRECSDGYRTVVLNYVAADDNGASDVSDPRIAAISPVGLLSVDGVPLALNTPRRNDVVEDLVTSEVKVNCRVKAPQLWHWTLQATDEDTPREEKRDTNQTVAAYYTNR
ncbi:MAG: hypothetical protein ACE5Q3_06985, partial [Alphaproteobacteria bacterium]